MRSMARSGIDEEPLAVSGRGNGRTNVLIDAKEDVVILLVDGKSPLKNNPPLFPLRIRGRFKGSTYSKGDRDISIWYNV
jgi:hypothetical protein